MTDYAEYRTSRHLGGLDGLRAGAIAAVIAHHAGVGGVVGRGVLGVSTFFAISGFLVTTILLREQEATGTISRRNFHVRRMLRIWPLYYAVLALYVALVAAMERGTAAGARFFENLPYFLTFTANWSVDRAGGGRIIFVFAWSLATQEQFYLLWPTVLRFARRAAPALLVLVLALEQAVHHAAMAGAIAGDALVARLFTRSVWSPICVGALLAFVLHAPRGFRAVRRVAGGPWGVPLGVALVIGGAASRAVPMALFYAAVAYLIAASVLATSAPIRRVLDARPLVHVGVVSYGIYLLHMLAVNAARRLVPGDAPLAVFAVAFPLSVVAATVSYAVFERRFLALKERFVVRAEPTAAVPAAVPSPAVRE